MEVIANKSSEFQEKKIIHLEGLTCANCASKIETRVKNLEGVIAADINLINQTINLSILDERSANILAKIKEIVYQLEPHVKVYETGISHKDHHLPHGATDKSLLKKELIKIGIGGLLFIIALLLDIDIKYNFFIFLASYLIVGGEVILRAGRNIILRSLWSQ